MERLTAERRRHATARIAEGLLDRWGDFEAALRAEPFFRGENDRGWRADFAWLLRPGKWISLVERAAVAPAAGRSADPLPARVDAILHARLAHGQGVALRGESLTVEVSAGAPVIATDAEGRCCELAREVVRLLNGNAGADGAALEEAVLSVLGDDAL